MDAPTITRRRIVAVGTATVLGGAGLALGTQPAGATASVDMGQLDIQDGEFSPSDGQVWAPWVLVAGTWEYHTKAQPAQWQAYMLVGRDGDTEAVGLTSGGASGKQDSGTYALRGAITAASFYDPSDFAVPDGRDSVTREVPVQVVFVVRDADNQILVDATVSDTAVVTVNNEGMTVASLSGSGSIVAQDNQDDATPAMPGGN